MMQRWLLFALTLGAAISVRAATTQTDEQVLEAKVKATTSTTSQQKNTLSVKATIEGIRALRDNAAAQAPACVEARKSVFGGKYVITFDAANKPCKIYDLSFPTLRTAFARPVTSIPVQSLTAHDYLSWLTGHYDEVYKKINDVSANFNAHEAATASWVAKVQFRKDTTAGAQAVQALGVGQLPASFHASDLEVGEFKFNDADRAQLKQLISDVHALSNPGMMTTMSSSEDFLATLADRPEVMLSKMRFDWNDARKVYDVFIEGEFLPLNGPIALVDYNVQYKVAVEYMLRSVISIVTRNLLSFVPAPVVRDLLDVAINDTFEFTDMTYNYQMNQLEGALRAGAAKMIKIDASDLAINQGLNILAGSRSSLMAAYITSMSTGKAFDWNQIEKLGRDARYQSEKQRGIQLNNTYSRLVLKNGCSMEIVRDSFGICTKNGQKEAMYSLISGDTVVLGYDLGAPKVFNYKMPMETTLKRSTTWLLSVGVRLIQVPFVSSLRYSIANILKGYAISGLTDEAFLQSSFMVEKLNQGSLDANSENLKKWLYIQNINPFLPKTEGMEQGVIQANAALLGVKL